MTGPPESYYRSCVPIALSALTGLSIDLIARSLWHGGAVRTMGVAGSVVLGTSTLDAFDIMAFRFDIRAALALPAGRMTAEETMTVLADRRHAGVVEVRRHQAADRPSSDAAGESDDIVTAADWPHAGAWLLEVDVDGTGHALALFDKKVVAGGQEYAERAVRCGWEIILDEEGSCLQQ